MDVIKVVMPENVCPVISDPHNPKWPTIIKGGWEDVRWGGGEGAILDPTWDISQEDWFGGTGVITEGDGIGGKKPVTGDIREGGDSEGYITDEDTTGLIEGDYGFGGWDAHSGDWGFIGGGSSNIGGGTGGGGIKHLGDTNIPKHEVPKRGDDQYDAATEYGGIILKVDGSSWFGGSDYISGEGLLIGGVEESIDGDDDIGHTCPFIKAEKQIVQPRT